MSRSARFAVGAVLLSLGLALTGFVLEMQSTSDTGRGFSERLASLRDDLRLALALDLTTEDILADPKLDAERAALLKKIEQYQANAAAREAGAEAKGPNSQ